jgi:hypothetical protein
MFIPCAFGSGVGRHQELGHELLPFLTMKPLQETQIGAGCWRPVIGHTRLCVLLIYQVLLRYTMPPNDGTVLLSAFLDFLVRVKW